MLSMIKLRPHADRNGQEGKLASLAYDVLAILACGQPYRSCQYARPRCGARGAASRDGCETAQFSAVVCIHNLTTLSREQAPAKDTEAVAAATNAVLEAMKKHKRSERANGLLPVGIFHRTTRQSSCCFGLTASGGSCSLR